MFARKMFTPGSQLDPLDDDSSGEDHAVGAAGDVHAVGAGGDVNGSGLEDTADEIEGEVGQSSK